MTNPGEMHLNFQQLVRPASPNYFLACPKKFCNIKADMTPPVYPVSIDYLKKKWSDAISKEARWTLLSEEGDQMAYIQRSAVFRFPDFIHVQFYSLSPNSSTLAILSRSKYGCSDFGVNKKRVNRLLNRLK